MTQTKFPELLYVMEPVGPKSHHEGYRTIDEMEDGDTLAVYQLQRVCKVKVSKLTELMEAP